MKNPMIQHQQWANRRLVAAGILVLAVAAVTLLLGVPSAQATSSYLAAARRQYPTIAGKQLDSCDLCHTSSLPALNNFGRDYQSSGHNFAVIEQWDSDGDGIRNINEIGALSFPGNNSSVPGGSRVLKAFLPMASKKEPAQPTPGQANALSNPGFEAGSGSSVTGWEASGSVQRASDAVHSGSYALKLSNAATAYSNWIPVSPDWVVSAAAWIRTQNAAKLRITLYAYDANKVALTGWPRFWDLTSFNGSTDWRRISYFALTPSSARFMRLRFELTGGGTAWLDDSTTTLQTIPTVNLGALSHPLIIPAPWKLLPSSARLPLGSVAVVLPASDTALRTALDAYLTGIGSAHAFLDTGAATLANYATLLRFADSAVPEVSSRLNSRFPGTHWADLGSQGYFLSTFKNGAQTTIYAAANSQQGRFYALASLKQTIQGGQLLAFDALDKPSVLRRGIIVSAARFSNYQATLQQLADSKYNFAWSQGAYLNEKFRYDWRSPLSAGERSLLQAFLNTARSYFVDPWFSLGPRAASPAGAITCYSCDSDIDAAVSKMNVMYALGVRNFGLNFDDLWNIGQDRLLAQQDLARFGTDLGLAHVYFITQVFNRLKAGHADINFMVVPAQCYQAGNFSPDAAAYLARFAQLPAAIQLLSVQYSDEDFLASLRLSGRPTMGWSNFYAESWAPNGTYVAPYLDFYNPANTSVTAAITGLSYLPIQPGQEDAAAISWSTTADFFWAPDRYDPTLSFQRAAARSQGW